MDGAYCLLKHLVRHALPGTGIDSQLVLRVYGSEKNVTDPCHMLRLKLLFPNTDQSPDNLHDVPRAP